MLINSKSQMMLKQILNIAKALLIKIQSFSTSKNKLKMLRLLHNMELHLDRVIKIARRNKAQIFKVLIIQDFIKIKTVMI